ncbi:ATP-dependent helicase [Candidatus Phytoplasma phoenicium]|uniref:DNA 3'-5' helicase n=1 Tax=Candidatus Phytoplasma phoenicium TaxID=198422 RepID=A0A0L0MKW5_9MOLU|nr:ATP-dependent helicase [Candidatus Phytoplasma phoenicium]KND62629.1 ATP-dependent DNA helicase UvrD/PcrA [Candidatus Phytoplasma phoenicium]
MMNFEWLKQLNPEQLNIATSVDKKSLYVMAGAGTGKTRVLTTRIAFLLKQLQIPSDQILAITFTNNAVKEMQQRLQPICSSETFAHLTILTFHAFGNQILKQYISHINSCFNVNFNIIDEQESKTIIKECIKNLNLDKNLFPAGDMQKNIAKMKIYIIKKEILDKIQKIYQHEEWFNHNYQTVKFQTKEAKKIFKSYQSYLQKNNLVDFDDLLIYAYQLLSRHKEIFTFYQNKFTYILVDEFQDIDLIQYQIIKMISLKCNIFVVGDPNQNIYSFRGADLLCNHLFVRDFQASIKNLTQNYRSTMNILDAANLLISYNYNSKTNPFQNNLQSFVGYGKNIIYQEFANAQKEAENILKKIQYLVQKKKYQYRDIAILYRLNQLSKDIEHSFLLNDIPYRIQGYTSFYQKKEIKDIIAYLQILINPHNNFYLKRIINFPSRNIGIKTVSTLEQIAEEQQITLFSAIQQIISTDHPLKKKLKTFQIIFQELSEVFYNPGICNLSNVILLIDDIIAYSQFVNNEKKTANAMIKKNKQMNIHLERLQNILSNLDQKKEGNFIDQLTSFLNSIALFQEADKSNEISDNVILSSIHKSKGLEFKIVFAIGWEDYVFQDTNNTFKHSKFNNDNLSFQEERRLAYVAITRARELLYISSVMERIFFGKIINTQPVRFIEEMKLKTVNNDHNMLAQIKKNINHNFFPQKPRFSPKPFTLYKIGEKLKHPQFGIGTIISLEHNKGMVSMIFPVPYGIKKFSMQKSCLIKLK